MLTDVKQLIKFVNIRNKSSFNTNLQFGFDADECGFDVSELGTPSKIMEGEYVIGYEWNTPFGKLIEQHGKLKLEVEVK